MNVMNVHDTGFIRSVEMYFNAAASTSVQNFKVSNLLLILE